MKWLVESPALVVLVVSRAVSKIGDTLFALATTWSLLSRTHSVLLAAFVPLMTMLPPILLSLPLATLADRWPKKLVMVVTDWGRAVLVLLVSAWMLQGPVSPPLVYGVALALTVGGLLFTPAITAVFPRIVPPQHLTKANGLWSALLSAISVAGYAVGGVLVAMLRPGPALMLDGGTFLASGALLAILNIPDIRAQAEKGLWGFLHDSGAGPQFLWQDRYWRRVIFVVLPLNLLFGPIQIFSRVFSRTIIHAGAAAYGAIEAMAGLGFIVSGLIVSRVARWFTLQGWLHVATLGSGVSLSASLLLPTIPLAMAAYFLIALIPSLLSIPFVSAIERMAPADRVGRVMQTLFLLTGGLSVPAGLFLGSWAMDVWVTATGLWAFAMALGMMGILTLGLSLNPPAEHALASQYPKP